MWGFRCGGGPTFLPTDYHPGFHYERSPPHVSHGQDQVDVLRAARRDATDDHSGHDHNGHDHSHEPAAPAPAESPATPAVEPASDTENTPA